jgi:ATP-dependent DNA helicase RecQ
LEPIHNILKQYWGYSTFREGQEAIIQSVLEGQDVLAVMPTGGGKSICYQIPALVLGGTCLVITPLVALMVDQVQELQQKGIRAAALHSGLSVSELYAIYDEQAEKPFSFIYLSPERLQSEAFQEEVADWPLQLLAVDEAHCISQWGYDFRPAYLHIVSIRDFFTKVPCIAVTASATEIIRTDIQEKLRLHNPAITLHSFERPNISFSVIDTPLKLFKTTDILSKVKGACIIYCRNRKQTQELAETLTAQGFNANYYHAGLSYLEKQERQQAWIENKVTVLVATNAFGMGINKPDVRLVIHYDSPDAPESFYQEAGRAGRDGLRSYHVLFTNTKDTDRLKMSMESRYPPFARVREVYDALGNYLGIPLYTGEEERFAFHLIPFCTKFKLDMFEVMGALHALELNGYVLRSEAFAHPSTIQVIASKSMIAQMETQFPKLDEVLKQVLRTYSGILSFPVSINEFFLAQQIQASRQYVTDCLQALHHRGMITYVPGHDAPEISYLQNRVPAALLQLNEQHWNLLKQRFQKRVLFMLSLASQRSRCRSRYLLSYFEEQLDHDCGICDICNRKKKNNDRNEMEEIKNSILHTVKQDGVLVIEHFVSKSSVHQKEKILLMIRMLLDESFVQLNTQGELILA